MPNSLKGEGHYVAKSLQGGAHTPGAPGDPPPCTFFFCFVFVLFFSTLPPMQSIKGNAKIDQNWGMP